MGLNNIAINQLKVELDKKPITIGNSRGFRIKKEECPLKYSKTYRLIILEVKNNVE